MACLCLSSRTSLWAAEIQNDINFKQNLEDKIMNAFSKSIIWKETVLQFENNTDLTASVSFVKSY
jgi:uncharacterized protein YkvS